MTTYTSQESDRKQRVRCCHCGGVRTGNRPRGLCWTCYYTPSVRSQYPADPCLVRVQDGCYEEAEGGRRLQTARR